MSDPAWAGVEWPDELGDRTPAKNRERGQFQVSLARAFRDLEKELDWLGAEDLDYRFDAPQRQKDKRPYSDSSPDDPAFVLEFWNDGKRHMVGCDRYPSLRSNVREVGLYIHEKRMMQQRETRTAAGEFENLRLPPAENGDSATPLGDGSADDPLDDAGPFEYLGLDESASEDEIREAFRERAKHVHPDMGGDEGRFTRLKNARDEALEKA
jgi:hypothetical protein